MATSLSVKTSTRSSNCGRVRRRRTYLVDLLTGLDVPLFDGGFLGALSQIGKVHPHHRSETTRWLGEEASRSRELQPKEMRGPNLLAERPWRLADSKFERRRISEPRRGRGGRLQEVWLRLLR